MTSVAPSSWQPSLCFGSLVSSWDKTEPHEAMPGGPFLLQGAGLWSSLHHRCVPGTPRYSSSSLRHPGSPRDTAWPCQALFQGHLLSAAGVHMRGAPGGASSVCVSPWPCAQYSMHAGHPLRTHGGLLNRGYLLLQETHEGQGLCLYVSRLFTQRTAHCRLGPRCKLLWGGWRAARVWPQ